MNKKCADGCSEGTDGLTDGRTMDPGH